MKTTKQPEKIEKEMAITRSRIDQTIDEIGERVNPDAMQAEAKRRIRQAREYVEQKAEGQMQGATSRLTEAGSSAKDTIRRHPLVAALIGIGAGLMLTYRKRQKNHEPPIIEEHY